MKSKNLPGIQVICSPCPLISKIPTLNNPLARRCGEIIENARHIWGYYSPEEQSVCYEIVDGVQVQKKFPPYSTLKLTSARSIQSWYVEHSDLMLTNPKIPEAIKKAVQDVRRHARPSIETTITDKEILAIFAICEAFDAIRSIQQGKPEEAIREKVLSAKTFLNLAKAGFEPEMQNVPHTKLDEPIANDAIFFDKENGYLWFGDGNRKLIESEDAKILAVLIDIFSNRRSICRIEEVILSAYGKTIPTDSKIANNPMYNKYRSAVGAINGKYRELLKTQDKNCKLIQADGKRIVKLSRNVMFRKVLRK